MRDAESAAARGNRRRPPFRARSSCRAVLLLSGLFLLLLASAAPASAYWSSAGSGSGSAPVGTLARPTDVTVPTSSSATVPVSWTASAGSPSPTGYYVTRTSGGSAAAACGSSATTLLVSVSCTDSAVPVGTYVYLVTAVYRSWTATSVPSGSVTVTLVAARVVFTAQPTDTLATVAISPPVAVAVQSATGAPVPVAGTPVIISIGANPGSGTLSGTRTALTDSRGVATFADLSIDKSGVGYTLTATSSGLTSATSSTFAVAVGPATQLAFTTSPGDSFAGWAFYSQPVVAIEDAGGNVVTTRTDSVQLVITGAAAGAKLSCTAARNAVAGVATFSGCSIDTVRTYTLTAGSGSLTNAVSTTFNVVTAPTRLAWSGVTTTRCTGGSGTTFALVYRFCYNLIGNGTFTAKVALTDSSGTPVANLGTDLTVTLAPAAGSVTSTSVRIVHGQSVSSTGSTFTPGYGLLGLLPPTVAKVTASAPLVTTAEATLYAN